jgi:hypothetical protein
MPGEELHARGADGARRAKLWLEATTRASVYWVTPEPVAVRKLAYPWADGRGFSFDLGGVLLGEGFHGQEFVAEVKLYRFPGDQGSLYSEYLAKCYRAHCLSPDRIDHFMWITWSPFSVTRWADLTSAEEVRGAVSARLAATVGFEGGDPARAVSDDICRAVSDKLWIFVLSEKQERLVISQEHLAVLRAHSTGKRST